MRTMTTTIFEALEDSIARDAPDPGRFIKHVKGGISATHYCAILEANVDNMEFSDTQFRDWVRRHLMREVEYKPRMRKRINLHPEGEIDPSVITPEEIRRLPSIRRLQNFGEDDD